MRRCIRRLGRRFWGSRRRSCRARGCGEPEVWSCGRVWWCSGGGEGGWLCWRGMVGEGEGALGWNGWRFEETGFSVAEDLRIVGGG